MPKITITPFDQPQPETAEHPSNLLPAGDYYMGDPCYVLGPIWDDVCAAMFQGTNSGHDGVYRLGDLGLAAIAGTAHGDGVYISNDGSEFGVDAGCLSVVSFEAVALVNNIHLSEVEGFIENFGAAYNFEDDFYCDVQGGVITFDDVVINTDDDEEEDLYREEDEAYEED